MKKLISFIFFVLIIVVVVFAIWKNQIIKVAVEAGTKKVTGLDLNIQSLNIGLTDTLVDIQGLKLHNPTGYQDPIMVDIPQIYVDYNLSSILGGKIHLQNAKLNLSELVVVKNEKGELNLNALKPVEQKPPSGETKTPGQEGPQAKQEMPKMQIDLLELKIGKVIYKDYSKGSQPEIKEFNVNINEKFENITDPNVLVKLIIFKALSKTALGDLANFDLGVLKGSLDTGLKDAQAVVSGTVDTAEKTLKETTGKAKETLDSLKETTQGLTDTFKLPFGKEK